MKKFAKLGCYCGCKLNETNIKISYEKREQLLKTNKAMEIKHPCSNCGDNYIVIFKR